ncbi:UbiA family prenyltransferase [Halobacterium wangiae]|uniref:UbiA family prenyltransferase n=1 Tax=Halobacterium wangiae TaxID=2902623 RepID=UPI001E4E2537|nr:UbiA family prenyltransferase [Halobacterium wangiae]
MHTGVGRRELVGLLSAVKPTFMLPAVALAMAGGALAPVVDLTVLFVHAGAVAAALYTAHVVDEYVDAHVRGEDDAVLSASYCAYAAAGSSVAFFALLAVLWVVGARAAAVASLPLWLLAVLHAPALDRHPLTVTVDYPVGVALAFVAGSLAQTGVLTTGVLAVAVSLVVSLSGLKVAIDRLDRTFDATIGKRTLPVLLGDRRGARVAAAVHVLAAVLVGGLVVASTLAPVALLAALVSLVAAAVARSLPPLRSVRVQMALAYPFTAALLAAQCVATDCAARQLVTAASLGV